MSRYRLIIQNTQIKCQYLISVHLLVEGTQQKVENNIKVQTATVVGRVSKTACQRYPTLNLETCD